MTLLWWRKQPLSPAQHKALSELEEWAEEVAELAEAVRIKALRVQREEASRDGRR